MSASYETTQRRFFRPADVARIRRNQRRIQVLRILRTGGRMIVVVGLIAGALSLYRHTQSDSRFAVKTIEVVGAVHTPRASIDAITRRYVGTNLFKIEIAGLQRELRTLGWVVRIEAEKKLPDTLRIRIVERAPMALVHRGEGFAYLDENGLTFADLSPLVGDQDLPLIEGASGGELSRSIALVRDLRARDPEVFSRVSEVRPVAPDGFAIFDRQLGATVFANASDLSEKFRQMYAVARAEGLGRSAIEYADLRFAGRIVMKPVRTPATAPSAPPVVHATDITN